MNCKHCGESRQTRSRIQLLLDGKDYRSWEAVNKGVYYVPQTQSR